MMIACPHRKKNLENKEVEILFMCFKQWSGWR